jgi:predicted SAM-dependent methyltransferase
VGARNLKVDLCCGAAKPAGFVGVDFFAAPGVDIVHDLRTGFPFEDSSVEHLRAHDAIEHLPDRIHTMNEIWRVCRHGATVDISVPSTDGRGAFQDPTHVSFWNINSFFYYCSDHRVYHEQCRRYGFKGDFRIRQLYNHSKVDGVVHVVAHLVARKDRAAPA